ncbi:hypothetical protein [Mycetocola reblochoni]|uniref:hypothetical protein n=1 Tax=Mycetocola reblochoni TaxID=331618 RepID=UPI000B34C1EC|nr:hypothetical protein [Mycetocola reblochoni]
MTENIDHRTEALERLGDVWDPMDAEMFAAADSQVKMAQVHATLALAEQQRIANLIALYQADSDILDDPRFDAAKADIRKALGLS